MLGRTVDSWIWRSDTKQVSKGICKELWLWSGRRFGHSIEEWHTSIRQAWLLGFLHRKLSIGNGINMLASVAFATFSVSSTGMDHLTESQGSPVMLPMNPVTSEEKSGEKKKQIHPILCLNNKKVRAVTYLQL